MTKVVLIGVDGATFDIMGSWLADGSLPNFSSVASEGVTRTLRSVIPTKSIPAWPSFNAGKNPAKHGLFAFNEDVKTAERELVDSRNLKESRFWDALADDGVTPGVLGGLMTYPPRDPIRGFEISGPMTPATATDFARPDDIIKEIHDVVPDYSFGPELHGDRRDVQEACLNAVESRAAVSKRLMKERDWDFYSVLFISTDRIQHKLWNTPEMICPVYERVDQFVGWVRKEYPDANVVLVSDHGFTAPPERDFHIGTWLQEAVSESADSASVKYGVAKRTYSLIRNETGVNLRRFVPTAVESWLTGSGGSDDASESVRAATGTAFDGVWVPDGIEEYERTRTEMIDKLTDLTDPKTGQPVVRAAWKREELYEGAWLNKVPDIVLLPTPGYHINANPYPEPFSTYPGMENEGTHDAAPDGILMASGPDFDDEGSRGQSALLDVPPTILHLFGTPVPDDLDGDVLTGILSDQAAEQAVTYQEPMAYENVDIEMGEYDRKDVEDRLNDLGYL